MNSSQFTTSAPLTAVEVAARIAYSTQQVDAMAANLTPAARHREAYRFALDAAEAAGSETIAAAVRAAKAAGNSWQAAFNAARAAGQNTRQAVQTAAAAIAPQPTPQQPAFTIIYNRHTGRFDVCIAGFVVGETQSYMEGEQVITQAIQAMHNECLTPRELHHLWLEKQQYEQEQACHALSDQAMDAAKASGLRYVNGLPAQIAAYEAETADVMGRAAA